MIYNSHFLFTFFRSVSEITSQVRGRYKIILSQYSMLQYYLGGFDDNVGYYYLHSRTSGSLHHAVKMTLHICAIILQYLKEKYVYMYRQK